MDEDQLQRILTRARLGANPCRNIRELFVRHFVAGGTEQEAFFDCHSNNDDCESRRDRERDRDRGRDVGHDSDAMRCALERTATNIQMMLNSLDEMAPPNRPIGFTLEITTALAVNDDKRSGGAAASGRITGHPVTVQMPLQFDPRTRQLSTSCPGQQQQQQHRHQRQASICGSRSTGPQKYPTDYPALTYLQDECRCHNNSNAHSRPQDIQTDQSYLQKHRQQSPVSCPSRAGAAADCNRPSQTETSYLRDHQKPQFEDALDNESEGTRSSQNSQTERSYVNESYKRQHEKLMQEATSQTNVIPCESQQDREATVYSAASNRGPPPCPCPCSSKATTADFYRTPCGSSTRSAAHSSRHTSCGCSLHNYLPRSEMDNRPPFASDPRPMTFHDCLCGGQHQSNLPPWAPNPNAQHIALSNADTNCSLQWAANNEEAQSFQSAANTCYTQNSNAQHIAMPNNQEDNSYQSAANTCYTQNSSKVTTFASQGQHPCSSATSGCPITSTIDICPSKGSSKDYKSVTTWADKTVSGSTSPCPVTSTGNLCPSTALAEAASSRGFKSALTCGTKSDSCPVTSIEELCASQGFVDPCSSKGIVEPCSSKTVADPCSSKTIADPCSLKSLADPCALKSVLDLCSSKANADPCSSKAIADPCSSKAIADLCSMKSLVDTCASKATPEPCSSRGHVGPDASKLCSCASKAVSNPCFPDASSINTMAQQATCGTQISVLPASNLDAGGSDVTNQEDMTTYTNSGLTHGLPSSFGYDDQTSATSRSRSIVNKITCLCSSDQKSIYNNRFEKGPREEGHVQYGDELLLQNNSDHCNICEVCPPPHDPMQSIGSTELRAAPARPLQIKCAQSTCTCSALQCKSKAALKSQSKSQSHTTTTTTTITQMKSSKQVCAEEQDVFRDCASFNSNTKSTKSKSGRRLSYKSSPTCSSHHTHKSLPIITSCYSNKDHKDGGVAEPAGVCPCGICGISQKTDSEEHSKVETSVMQLCICGQDANGQSDVPSMEMKSCYDPSLDKQSESGFYHSPDTSAYTDYADPPCKELVVESRKERIMDMVQQLSDAADCECNEDRPAMIQNLFRELTLMLRMEEERAVAPQDELKPPKPTFEECCAVQQQCVAQPPHEHATRGAKERRRNECFETLEDAVRKCFMKREARQLPEVEIYGFEQVSDSDMDDACELWLPPADSTEFKDAEGQGCGHDEECYESNSKQCLLEKMTKLMGEPGPEECGMCEEILQQVVEPCGSYDRNKFDGNSYANLESCKKTEPQSNETKVMPSNCKLEQAPKGVDICASQEKPVAPLDHGKPKDNCSKQDICAKIEPCPTSTSVCPPSQVPSATNHPEICVKVENYKQTESCTSVNKGKKNDSKQQLCGGDFGNLLPDGALSPEARQLCEKLLRQALVDCGACDKLAPSQSCQSSEGAAAPKGAGHCQCCHCRALRSDSECKTVSKTLRSAMCDPACEMKYFIDSMIVDLEVMDHVLAKNQARAKDVRANCSGNAPGNSYPVTISTVSSLGCSALYIRWDVQDCAGIAGYEIYVDGNLRNRLYSFRHDADVVANVDVTKGHQIVLRAQAIGQEFPGDDLPVGNCKTVARSSHPEMAVGAKRPWSPSIYFYDPSVGIKPSSGARRASQT